MKQRADQIREMSNEELANFIKMIHGNGVLRLHPDRSWLEWLEMEEPIWLKVE